MALVVLWVGMMWGGGGLRFVASRARRMTLSKATNIEQA